MIDFAPPAPRHPHRFRIAYALRELKERLGASEAPTPELREEVAEKYGLTREQLDDAWIEAGRS